MQVGDNFLSPLEQLSELSCDMNSQPSKTEFRVQLTPKTYLEAPERQISRSYSTLIQCHECGSSSPRTAKAKIPGGYPRWVSQQFGKYMSRTASSVSDVRERDETWHKSNCHVTISHPSTGALSRVFIQTATRHGGRHFSSIQVHMEELEPSWHRYVISFIISTYINFKTCGGCPGTTTLLHNWVDQILYLVSLWSLFG